MGFGLHAGKAIEGALGSELKIDISYLSENVTMSSKLEELTKEYNKSLLFTNSIYNLIKSSKIRNLCRRVDSFKIEQMN